MLANTSSTFITVHLLRKELKNIFFIYLGNIFCPCQVNYINAHATSTIVGDLAEVNAVKKVFKNTSGIKMNATKVISISLSHTHTKAST